MRVLLGVDGSFNSMYAAEEVARRQWPDGVVFRVLCAVPDPIAAPDLLAMAELASAPRLAAARANAERLATKVAALLRGRGFVAQPVVRTGDPRPALVKEAEKWNADLVVVGSHGQSGLKRLLLGSVASYVATHAPCSVEIIREKKGGSSSSRWK